MGHLEMVGRPHKHRLSAPTERLGITILFCESSQSVLAAINRAILFARKDGEAVELLGARMNKNVR
jgi:hypothetical protein